MSVQENFLLPRLSVTGESSPPFFREKGGDGGMVEGGNLQKLETGSDLP